MKFTTATGLVLAASGVSAFPGILNALDTPSAKATVEKRQVQGAGANPSVPPPFIAQLQHVSTTGQHAFVAPGPTDIRGECPGLNAMANHGYLPHNGMATTQQFIDATETVFGMSTDLGGFLSYFGSWVDGTGAGWAIGAGPHIGIGGSHGNYETDSSPLKSDLNQYGSNGKLIMEQFYNLYNMQPDAATANYNLEVLREFRGQRFQESIAKNPYFTYNPFAGILVSQAAFTFIYRFMSNKSAENPEGVLNKDVLKSFMSITGPENNLTWTFGHERIPDNWYKRSPTDEYSIPYFFSDIGYFAQTQPEILTTGCNLGAVNTYTPFSAGALTNGAYTDESAKANAPCFSLAYAKWAATNQYGLTGSALTQMLSSLTKAESTLGGCPEITSFDASMYSVCPGASLYGGPMGMVAPGAIQS